jgi:hypothetical protein
MGGTIFRQTAEATAALVGVRDLLPRMPEFLAWARALAGELPAVGITPDPTEPHAPQFFLHAAGDADDVNRRLLAVLENKRLAVCGPWRPGHEPGRVRTEVMVGEAALTHDPHDVAQLLGEIVAGA